MNGLTKSIIGTLVAIMFAGCANMTPQQRNTAVGAALGGVAGSVLTDGNAAGVIGGAAIGGYIGNQNRR